MVKQLCQRKGFLRVIPLIVVQMKLDKLLNVKHSLKNGFLNNTAVSVKDLGQVRWVMHKTLQSYLTILLIALTEIKLTVVVVKVSKCCWEYPVTPGQDITWWLRAVGLTGMVTELGFFLFFLFGSTTDLCVTLGRPFLLLPFLCLPCSDWKIFGKGIFFCCILL